MAPKTPRRGLTARHLVEDLSRRLFEEKPEDDLWRRVDDYVYDGPRLHPGNPFSGVGNPIVLCKPAGDVNIAQGFTPAWVRRSRCRKSARQTTTGKLASETNTEQDDVGIGSEEGDYPFVFADAYLLTDQLAVGTISRIEDDCQRRRELGRWAVRISILREMERAAAKDPTALAALFRFDFRYLALPEFTDALYLAKVGAIYNDDHEIRKTCRIFLRDVADVLRALPSGRSKPIIDMAVQHEILVSRLREAFARELADLSEGGKRAVGMTRLSNYLLSQTELTRAERRATRKTADHNVFDLAWLFGRGSPAVSVRAFCGCLLRRDYDLLARKILAAERSVSVSSVVKSMRRSRATALHPLVKAGLTRDWAIVEKWWAGVVQGSPDRTLDH